ncbi:MAG: S41 family peptidase [Oscillospiraceae bacterium]|nr:S41 family peptidase [Oscillospiraceae bacterium]
MKRKYSLWFVVTLMLFASALTWAGMVIIVGFPFGPFSNRSDAVRDYASLLIRIEDSFIGEYDMDAVSTAAKRAAVAALNDEWSFYMTAEEFARSRDSAHNRYEGIGVMVSTDEQTQNFQITYVFRGSPAEESGILSGDIIIAVDGNYTKGMTIAQLGDLLSRPLGNTAELTIERMDGCLEIIPVVFRHIFLDPVSFQMLDDDIGLIRLYNFNEGSARSFISATNDLIQDGAAALIFDVRGNPGGWVNEVSDILDFLLPEGEIFVTVDRAGNEFITMSNPYYVDLPMVVIVDRFSFSGAEYFAAMLSEYGFAEVVGEQTTGKSRMQRVIPLPGGGAINISFAEYLTKNRVSLHDEGGFTPDHIVPLSEAELELLMAGELALSDDPQVQAAIQILGR